MLKILLKKQMAEIFRNYVYDPKKNKKRSKASTIGFIIMYAVLMIGVLGGLFTYLALSICSATVSAGMGWLFFTLIGLLAIFMGAFGSVFNTYSALYLSKDNDFLLSLPIPAGTIVISRLLGVYLMGLMYSGVVMIPAIVVYMITAPFSISALVCSVLLFAAISVIVLILSCILGWVVAKISVKLKNKSFITVIVSLLFITIYYIFYFKAQEWISQLVENIVMYGTKIKNGAYPLYVFGRAGEGDWGAAAAVVLVTAVLFFITWRILSGSFLKIATSTGKSGKTAHRKSQIKQKSMFGALLTKEFSRFIASPNYMLNCGFGTLLLPVAGIFVIIKGGDMANVLRDAFDSDTGFITVILCAAVCMIASMNIMVAPSVSLEGKNIWLLQSLPVPTVKILQAKLLMQIVLTSIPTLFCVVCTAFVLKASFAQTLLLMLVPIVYTVFSAILGLTLGLGMPNMTWTNEIVPIKQSGSVMISLFGGWAYAIIIAVVYIIIGNKIGAVPYLSLILAVTAIISLVLYNRIKKRGPEIFANL